MFEKSPSPKRFACYAEKLTLLSERGNTKTKYQDWLLSLYPESGQVEIDGEASVKATYTRSGVTHAWLLDSGGHFEVGPSMQVHYYPVGVIETRGIGFCQRKGDW